MNLQVLILCGGKGERLRPLTENLPKPLVHIKNNTILGHIIEHISSYEINEFIIATGYRAEKIEKYLNGLQTHCHFTTSNAGEVDIIQRLKSAIPLIKGDIILLYGDTLSDVNIKELLSFHQSHSGSATVTVWPLHSQFGVLEVDDSGKISSYQEKPILDKWINIGYFYFEQKVLQRVSGFDTFEQFLGHLITEKELNGFKHNGAHITVNTLKELQNAEDNIEKIYKTR